MKKFEFRLERVFRYHQQRLKQAEFRLAQAVTERDASQAAVDHYQNLIHRACDLNEHVGSVINPSIRTNLTAHVEQLGTFLTAAKERLKVSELRFRETERARAEISQEVEGFSHLRDLQRQQHSDEINRLQQIELDEVVMRKWSAIGEDDSLLSAEISE